MTTLARNANLLVPVEQLRRICPPVDPAIADGVTGVIGQERAMQSILLGAQMRGDSYSLQHYNIAVIGKPNTGRPTKTKLLLEQYTATVDAPPPDVISLYDFDEAMRPSIVCVPNGTGLLIREQFKTLGLIALGQMAVGLGQIRAKRHTALAETINGLWEEAMKPIMELGCIMEIDDKGNMYLGVMSIAKPGEIMDDAEVDALDDETGTAIQERKEQARAIAEATKAKQNQITEEGFATAEAQDKNIVEISFVRILREHFGELLEMVNGHEALTKYFEGFIEFVTKLILQPDSEKLGALVVKQGENIRHKKLQSIFTVMAVKVLVDNTGVKHPPVIMAQKTSHSALAGRVNVRTTGSGMSVDHTMIEAGAVLKANGGFLIIDLDGMLKWGSLSFFKLLETIKNGMLNVEVDGKLSDSIDYRPKPVPVNVRVVFICDRHLDQHLRENLQDYANLVRIVAEFEGRMPIEEAPAQYAAFLRVCQAKGHVPEFTPAAIAKLVEWGSRRVDDQLKASTEVGILKDIITEAAQWAASDGSAVVEAQHVTRAIKERFDRQALVCRAYQENTDRGHHVFNHSGWTKAMVNGLSVRTFSEEIDKGGPLTVTARAYAGTERLLLVQRESDLSGPTSTTAIGIVRGLFSEKLGRRRPLKLAVQLCFEQCYGGLEGDSASIAEVVAAVSAITGLPVDQSLAVTGSLNQHGTVQVIGGQNEKIEGHVDALRGQNALTPGHGVILPRGNVENLMLREDVLEAVRNGLYEVYAVTHIDEALELMLGRPADEIWKLAERRVREIDAGTGLWGWFRRMFI